MISLLFKCGDDVTSNKYISLGISFASIVYLANRILNLRNPIDSMCFVIGTCAGAVFALLAKTYLVHNDRVKTDGEKNGMYALLSYIIASGRITRTRAYEIFSSQIFDRHLSDRTFDYENFDWAVHHSYRSGFEKGFGLGFLITNMGLQILEGKTKFKFQSPLVFE